jgi:tripartite ATP-independent transporter DctM subunit
MAPFAAIIFLVLGLMMMGVATPTESAAVGAIAALIFAGAMRRLTFKMVESALLTTVKVSAMMLLIIAGSKAFSQILAISGATKTLVDIISDLHLSQLMLFFVMQLIPLILGCLIDPVSVFMLTIPVYLPMIEAAGIDPIWFWCFYMVNATLGSITPPFGVFLFTLKGSSPSTTLREVYAAAWPFILLVLGGMVLMVIFPQIATWIPSHF